MASGEAVAFLLGNWIFLVRYWTFNFSIARGKCVEMMPVLRMNNRDYHPINKDYNEVNQVLWFTALGSMAIFARSRWNHCDFCR